MPTMNFSTQIKASKEKVWRTLWDDQTMREWTGIIDEGTYMKGELKEGNQVEFISAVNGYGVTSLVEKLVPNEYILFRQIMDTKESGAEERDKEWTGGRESYTLTEKDGVTTLTGELDVPTELTEIFQDRYPKALARVKEMAEQAA